VARGAAEPKRIPDAHSSALFGPGVIEPTNVKPASPSSSLIVRSVSWDASRTAVDNNRRGADALSAWR
jgi:hypothetical protein